MILLHRYGRSCSIARCSIASRRSIASRCSCSIAMGDWTCLEDVEEARQAGKTIAFPPALVYAANYIARNPFPRKFLYSACTHIGDTGLACNKSLEFGAKCGHSSPGVPKFRFQLILFDAAHGSSQPLKAQIWS